MSQHTVWGFLGRVRVMVGLGFRNYETLYHTSSKNITNSKYLQHVHEHSYAPDVALLAVAQVIYDFRSWKSWWIAWSLMGTCWKDVFPLRTYCTQRTQKYFLTSTPWLEYFWVGKMNMMLSAKRESGHKDLPAGSISVAQVGWLGGWMDRWMDTVGAEMKWNPLPVPLLEWCAADPLHHRGNTDGWIERQTNEWMDKWTDGWLDERPDRWMSGYDMETHTHGHGCVQTLCIMKGGWVDGWIDGWIDEEIDRWNESPIGRYLWMEFTNGGMDKWGEGWQMDR